MEIFAEKIEKLRAERDGIRGKYVEDVYGLQAKVKLLEEENQNLREKLTALSETDEQQNLQKEFLKISYQDIGLLSENLD